MFHAQNTPSQFTISLVKFWFLISWSMRYGMFWCFDSCSGPSLGQDTRFAWEVWNLERWMPLLGHPWLLGFKLSIQGFLGQSKARFKISAWFYEGYDSWFCFSLLVLQGWILNHPDTVTRVWLRHHWLVDSGAIPVSFPLASSNPRAFFLFSDIFDFISHIM